MVVDLILQLLLPLLYFETFTFKYKLAALLTLYFSSRSISFTFIVRMILKSKLIVTINAELHNGHDCFTKPCCTKAGSQIALAILQDSISGQELSLALLYLVEFQLGWYKRVQKNFIGELSFFIWSLWGACGILKTFQINLLHWCDRYWNNYCWQIEEEREGRGFEPPWPITDLSDLIISWTNFSLTWKLLWTYPSNHRITLWVIWLQNCSTWKIVAIKLKRWMQSSVLYK